ncbi:hypothetical protein GUITHDRAFT_108408 [Guillardia theta CCMP2712]|uniref:Spindle assembly abnormal protein 6 N-terminal domain-containing protein n=1 Tax=Guillardia theta (strain CCMP2712) TaxID=905079 RepID=L1JBN4_GUITC|nr:hypothetical protein GUITHDRAFT_108408 [Guillardia theta CCMP2712]EKX45534.1 hypothetical protein GUITHDRAFT_108408 [Guillardia theta CCMP2712]|eukprot:XP_005832514.1 hypothetical protein GUITHDRAFT_108408 [Guillardia theta CCMP2712]
MRIREDGREERRSVVCVSVSIQQDSQSTSTRQLMTFQLTDEADSFFLYTLRISEEEFQNVKNDQSILVDFAEFPNKFMELLECCLQKDEEEPPKFTASLLASGNQASLNIVETNQFKNLTHLRLEMRPGNDHAVKQYLAGELAKVKYARNSLLEQLRQVNNELQDRMKDADKKISAAEEDAKTARQELGDLKLRHASDCATLREQAVSLQQQLQQQSDADKSEMSKKYQDKEQSLQRQAILMSVQIVLLRLVQLDELRLKYDSIYDEKSNLLSANKDMQGKIESLENEVKILRSGSLQMLPYLVVFDYLFLFQLVDSAHAQKSNLEETLRMVRDQNAKQEEQIRNYGVELNKASENAERLQNELKTIKTKLKVKTAVVLQQEQVPYFISVDNTSLTYPKVLDDKEKSLLDQQHQCKSLEQTILEKDGRIDILNAKLKQAESQLQEAEKTLASNQNVIAWLNKEINDAQMSTRGAYNPSKPLISNQEAHSPKYQLSSMSMTGNIAPYRNPESFSKGKSSYFSDEAYSTSKAGNARPDSSTLSSGVSSFTSAARAETLTPLRHVEYKVQQPVMAE